MPAISIIVPVYKAEKYLHRCVDSILAQTFADFELLLIDDGSPDKCGKICDEFAHEDKRVKAIHKENGGVASARQCGIDNAIGEYSIHADPDDWIEPTMLEELYRKAIEEEADMVICDYFFDESKKRSIYVTQKPSNLESDSILRELLSQELHGSCCNKLIRKSLYTNYNISFPEEIIRWEDLFVVSRILASAPIKVAYLNKAFYHYDQYTNANSIVRKTTMKGLMSQIYFIDYFSKVLNTEQYDECFYRLKSSTKELAFASGLYSNEQVRDLYSEINERYISNKPSYYIKKCLSLCLRGKDCQSRALLWCYDRTAILKTMIKKIVY